MWLKRFILYSLCLIVSANTFGQSDIKGLIIDSADKEPLPGVTVLLKDSLNKICAYAAFGVQLSTCRPYPGPEQPEPGVPAGRPPGSQW